MREREKEGGKVRGEMGDGGGRVKKKEGWKERKEGREREEGRREVRREVERGSKATVK